MFIVFELLNGLGVCVDICGYVGYCLNLCFDLLLVKLIVYVLYGIYVQMLVQMYCVLCEFCIEGFVINKWLLQDLLCDVDVQVNVVYMQFFDVRFVDLVVGNSEVYFVLYVILVVIFDLMFVMLFFDEFFDDVEVFIVLMDGVFIQIYVEVGVMVVCGDVLVVIEVMKMEYVVIVFVVGCVLQVCVQLGVMVCEGQLLVVLQFDDV